MRIASIDIGTNTVLLLVADIDAQGIIHPVHHEERVPRLGRDVDKDKVIHVSAFDRIAWILNEYKNLSVQLGCRIIVACATSAVRDSANRADFLEYLGSTTGIRVEVLTGGEEAIWSYRGAVSGIKKSSAPAAVIDIGGGSTEVAFPPAGVATSVGAPLRHHSYQLGCVRLTEQYFHHTPPCSDELVAATTAIGAEWKSIEDLDGGNYDLIGVGGTVATLACLDQGLLGFEVEKVSGYALLREHVEQWLQKLSGMRPAEIEALSETTRGRADILTAGVLILAEFLNKFRFQQVIATERGLRHGMAIREWEKFRNREV